MFVDRSRTRASCRGDSPLRGRTGREIDRLRAQRVGQLDRAAVEDFTHTAAPRRLVDDDVLDPRPHPVGIRNTTRVIEPRIVPSASQASSR